MCNTIVDMREQKLSKIFHFRVSEKEYDWLNQMSSDLGLSPGSFLRMTIHQLWKDKGLNEAEEDIKGVSSEKTPPIRRVIRTTKEKEGARAEEKNEF